MLEPHYVVNNEVVSGYELDTHTQFTDKNPYALLAVSEDDIPNSMWMRDETKRYHEMVHGEHTVWSVIGPYWHNNNIYCVVHDAKGVKWVYENEDLCLTSDREDIIVTLVSREVPWRTQVEPPATAAEGKTSFAGTDTS